MFPVVPWDEFKESFRWKQGEHVMAVAPTGAGKTTLLSELIPMRKYSIFLGTKKDDKLYREIVRKHGFVRVESMDEIKPWENRIMLWPHHLKTIPQTYAVQRNAFKHALDITAEQGGWTLWADELKYMSEHLRMSHEWTYALEQFRSIGGTIIGGAQRPAWLPLSALSNASHVFLWKTNFSDDAKRLADIGGIDAKAVTAEMHTLGRHEFIYIQTRGTEARIVRTQVERH